MYWRERAAWVKWQNVGKQHLSLVNTLWQQELVDSHTGYKFRISLLLQAARLKPIDSVL